MSLWQSAKSLFSGGVSNAGTVATTDDLYKALLAVGAINSQGVVTNQAALKLCVVNRCVNLLTGVIGCAPFAFKDDTTFEEKPDHPLRAILNRRPNSFQTARDFKKLLTQQVLFRGNGYARIVRNGSRVIALHPLNPDQMAVDQNADLTLQYTYRRKGGGSIVFAQDDVFHLRGLSLDGITGLSPLQFAQDSMQLNRDTHAHTRNSVTKGNKAGGFVTHPTKLDPGGRATLKDVLEQFQDPANTGKTLLLDEGMKFEPISVSNADLEFLENRKLSIVELCMFFGVPPHMVGFTEKSTSWGSGIEEQTIGFINFTLNDWFEMWESAVEFHLLKNEPRTAADLQDLALRRGNYKSRWEGHAIALREGARPVNEIRRDEGLPPIPGGDVPRAPPNTAGTPLTNQESET